MTDDEVEQMLRGLVRKHLSGERQRLAMNWINDRQLLQRAMDDLDDLARTMSDEVLLRELYITKHVTENEVRYDQVVAAARLRGVSETDILVYTHKIAGSGKPNL
jgi:hypothetical protein